MKLVGAGFINQVDDAAPAASEFGGIHIRLDLKFLHRIHRRKNRNAFDRIGQRRGRRNAVHQDVGASRPAAVDREVGAVVSEADVCLHARREKDQ